MYDPVDDLSWNFKSIESGRTKVKFTGFGVLHRKQKKKNQAFMLALLYQHYPLMEKYMTLGADINAKSTLSFHNAGNIENFTERGTPLDFCMQHGHAEGLCWLIERGCRLPNSFISQLTDQNKKHSADFLIKVGQVLINRGWHLVEELFEERQCLNHTDSISVNAQDAFDGVHLYLFKTTHPEVYEQWKDMERQYIEHQKFKEMVVHHQKDQPEHPSSSKHRL